MSGAAPVLRGYHGLPYVSGLATMLTAMKLTLSALVGHVNRECTNEVVNTLLNSSWPVKFHSSPV